MDRTNNCLGFRTVPTCANALRTLALDDETRGGRLKSPKEALEIRTDNALTVKRFGVAC